MNLLSKSLVGLISMLVLSFPSGSRSQNDELEKDVTLSVRPLAENSDNCKNCHLAKTASYQQRNRILQKAHSGILLKHGVAHIWCDSCHDAFRQQQLLSRWGFESSWSNTSPVCKNCHGKIYREWTQGVHGIRTGHWKGPKVQKQCIDCHSPHDVKFAEAVALPPPQRPR